MVRLHDNIVGIDSAIFMHPKIWEASGHVGAFNDPLIDNRDSKKRYRADVLIEDFIAKQDEKIAKEVEKARKRFGEAFDEAKFLETNPRVIEHKAKRDAVHSRMVAALNDNNLEELRQIIVDSEIVCPISGTRNWTEVRQFNLMFETKMGSVSEGANTIYLRPETAQGIFVNFLNVQKTGRMKIPFGIAQIGKAFRNEIVARQFIFVCASSSRWRCSFSCVPARNSSGSKVEGDAHELAPRARFRRRALPFPRPRQGGPLCQCRDRRRIRISVRIQRGGGNPFAHRFRPWQPSEVLRQEDSVFRYRDRRKLCALRGRNVDRRRPDGVAGAVRFVRGAAGSKAARAVS